MGLVPKETEMGKPKATSAMGQIAQGLIQNYLGPDCRVADMERFVAALIQSLQDAYTQGWNDRGAVEKRPK